MNMWLVKMNEEMNAPQENCTYELVPLVKGRRVLKNEVFQDEDSRGVVLYLNIRPDWW